MHKRELVLLMSALTKGGKTTIAMALCHKEVRARMAKLGNCRTEVTVDWTYDADAGGILLVDIALNYKGVFGVDRREDINCEDFGKVLDGEKCKDGIYLKEMFGLEKQKGLSSEELEKYVTEKIREYINNCDGKRLAKLIRDRRSNKFLCRIKIQVPPADEFKAYFKEKNISLVLRDTRGLLDIDPEEADAVQNRTMQDLGIDGIDGVLLLGTSAPFADIVGWYKKAYGEAFEAVPVFIMTRADAASVLYDIKYGIDNENVTIGNVKNFLQAVKKGEERGYKELADLALPCYRLLETFGIGKIVEREFIYNYKVYNNEDLRYIYPVSTTLMQSGNDAADFEAPDYKLYEMIVYENMKDILDKMIEHELFADEISNEICNRFVAELQQDVKVEMMPNYDNYLRNEVCNSILQGDILGPRDGIVTSNSDGLKYLGALTSGISARIWLRRKVYAYEYAGVLPEAGGKQLIQNMPKECQTNLIRMALFKQIEKNTDYYAGYGDYSFINRYKVREAIIKIRNGNSMIEDALDEVSREIAGMIF